tara:strand:- start:261 stop:803 length:543 start_codon:yes stop_codon:yes gene_type:complete
MAYKQNPGGPRQARTGGNIPTSFMSGPAQVDNDAIKKSMESLKDFKEQDAQKLETIRSGKISAKLQKESESEKRKQKIKQERLKERGDMVLDSLNTIQKGYTWNKGKDLNQGEIDAANKYNNAGRAARTGGTKNKFGKGLPLDGSEPISKTTQEYPMVQERLVEARKAPRGAMRASQFYY